MQLAQSAAVHVLTMKQSTGVVVLHTDPPGVALTHAIGVALVPTFFVQLAPAATQVVPVQPPKVTWQSKPQPPPHEFASANSVAAQCLAAASSRDCEAITPKRAHEKIAHVVNRFIETLLAKSFVIFRGQMCARIRRRSVSFSTPAESEDRTAGFYKPASVRLSLALFNLSNEML